MNPKSLKSLLPFSFLLVVINFSVVLANDFQDGMDAANRGDSKEAVRLFRLSAAEGNATAQYNLGYLYEIGQGVPQDYQEAFKWFRIAAEQGFVQAQDRIGHMYLQGMGVKKDFEAAFKWHRLAAEQGYAIGQTTLGYLYEMGRGIPQDYKEAFKWYRRAAEQGNATAQHNLGNLYFLGQGVPQDYVLAHMWLNIAASNGIKDAVTKKNLVEKILTPQEIEKAQELAKYWGSPGLLVKQAEEALFSGKKESAKELYLRAAEKGSVEAHFSLAYRFILTPKERLFHYSEAAKGGHTKALEYALEGLLFRANSLKRANPLGALELYHKSKIANPSLVPYDEKNMLKVMKMCVEPGEFNAKAFSEKYGLLPENNATMYHVWKIAEDVSRGGRYGKPDPALILHLVCRGGWVPAELKIAVEEVYTDWKKAEASEFNICDHITSGAGMSFCASRQNDENKKSIDARLNELEKRLGIKAKPILRQAYELAAKFIEAKTVKEEMHEGSGVGAWITLSQIRQKNEYLDLIANIYEGFKPSSTVKFDKADQLLNKTYKKTIKYLKTGKENYPLPAVDQLREVQRLWIPYRDASAKLFMIISPTLKEDLWRSWLTETRMQQLIEIFGEGDKPPISYIDEKGDNPEKNKIVNEIKSLFSKWQPIIKKERENNFKNSKTLYGYGYYAKDVVWSFSKDDGRVLNQKIIYIKKNIGYLLIRELCGEHHCLFGEHYYNKKGELYFIFWRFNTDKGLNPKYWDSEGRIIPSAESDDSIPMTISVTEERRLYFDHNGNIIRNLQSPTYYINTKQETGRGTTSTQNIWESPPFEFHLNKLEFYEILKESSIEKDKNKYPKIIQSKNGGYIVSLKNFETEKLARQFRSELLKKGLTPNIERKENKWHLFIGPYPSEESAYQAKASIGEERLEEIKVFIDLKNLAEQGDVESQSVLGYMLATGSGVKKNYREAKYWLTQAATKGNSNAQYNLGVMYFEGVAQPRNYREALKLYKLAAKQDNSNAQYNIGWMYEVGLGVSQNKEKALKWYKLATEKNDIEHGNVNILPLSINSKRNPKGYQEPVKHLGDSEAQYQKGLFYAKEKNYRLAMKWLRLSAEQGNVKAENKISLLLAESEEAIEYFEGRGLEGDDSQENSEKVENDFVKERIPHKLIAIRNPKESIEIHSSHFAKCTEEKIETTQHENIVVYSVKAPLSCLLSPLHKTKPRSKSKTGVKFDRYISEIELSTLDSSSEDVLLVYTSLFDGSDMGDGPIRPLDESLIRLSGSNKIIIATGPYSENVNIQKVSDEYIIVKEVGSFFDKNYLISTTSMKADYLSDGSIEVIDQEKLLFKAYSRKSHFKEAGGAFWYTAIINRNGKIIDIDNTDLNSDYKTCFSKSDFLKKSYIELPESARDIVCVDR